MVLVMAQDYSAPEVELIICDACEEPIPVHRLPYVLHDLRPTRAGDLISVCARCAPVAVLRTLTRFPARDRAEETALDVFRRIIAEMRHL